MLEKLEPQNVFHFFEELCAIPHGSRNTKEISDYCVRFAKKRGLQWYQDTSNNVIIKKAASQGYEGHRPVIIQGHMDMVCEKTPDCMLDMEKEGLCLCVDGDRIFAKGTTLGGDDGIAIAYALAVLDDHTLIHPPLEVVFTVDEEIGMLGAAALDMSELEGTCLLNIDSEEEGVFTVSCAGGNVSVCSLPLAGTAGSNEALIVTVGGLTGGHSGVEIDKGRANANYLMARILWEIEREQTLLILSIEGGKKDNAIPRECIAVLNVKSREQAKQTVRKMQDILRQKYRQTEPDLFVKTETDNRNGFWWEEETSRQAVCLMLCIPNGIQGMSRDIPGLVQTSLNLGIATTTQTALELSYCVRSSVSSEKDALNQKLSCLCKNCGASMSINGDYAAWEYKKDSDLCQKMGKLYEELYQKKPRIEAIHAGVECGIFAGKIKDLDAVSFGPDLTEIHTPREKMSISSVLRVYTFLIRLLKEL